MSFISFSCLNAMTPNKMLNRYTSGHLCLVPDLWAGVGGRDFSLSPLNVMFLCGFFFFFLIDALYPTKEVPFYYYFVECFSSKSVLNFCQMIFLLLLR